MKAVVQRVKCASVTVTNSQGQPEKLSQIGPGLLTLLGVAKGDTEAQLDKLIKKICDLRIFEDDTGKMNLSLKDVGGAHLIVSQFTLIGDCTQGRRPSFVNAEEPKRARELYEEALQLSQKYGVPTHGGRFQADMKVELINDGPVTMIIEVSA